jgi:histidinol-phosphatase (PHP family)
VPASPTCTLFPWLTTPVRVLQEWLRLGGRFTFSDDSHGIAQVATNYHRGLDYLASLGVAEVWTLERQNHPGTAAGAKSALVERSVSLVDFRKSLKDKLN